MKINNISALYNYNTQLKYNSNYNFKLSFCSKTDNDGKSFEAFENWARKTSFLTNAKNIIQNPANVIGSGFEGKVYSIPNSDNWVIKEYFRSNILPKVNGQSDIEKVIDISPDLNIGQTIARINLPINDRYTETIFIHKKQEGKPLGVNSLLLKSVTDGTTKTHLDSLNTVASLPNESFSQLIDDIETISKLGYKIDGTTPHNLLLDESNKRINFVDISDKDEDKNTQYGEVLYALLGASFAERFLDSDRSTAEKTKAKDLSQIIIKKFITAMNEKNARFSPTYNFYSLANTTAFREFYKRFNNK